MRLTDVKVENKKTKESRQSEETENRDKRLTSKALTCAKKKSIEAIHSETEAGVENKTKEPRLTNTVISATETQKMGLA